MDDYDFDWGSVPESSYWGDDYGVEAFPPPYSTDFAPGSGQYQVGDGEWRDIYAPSGGSSMPAAPAPNWADYGFSRSQPTSWGSGDVPVNWIDPRTMPSLSGGGGVSRGGGYPSGGGGGGSYTPQPFQRIALGNPERTLYDRYSSMLLNPDQLAQDPAYKFLFNQGEQALNRSLAARRMTHSGRALNDTFAYGAGQAATGFKSLMPEYRAGAETELRRFMGPAGLLPTYAGVNNQATQQEGSAAAARELLPMYSGGGFEGPTAGASRIGFGGLSSGYTQRLSPEMLAGLSPSSDWPRPQNDILSELEGMGWEA